jgi:hypothetical protein
MEETILRETGWLYILSDCHNLINDIHLIYSNDYYTYPSSFSLGLNAQCDSPSQYASYSSDWCAVSYFMSISSGFHLYWLWFLAIKETSRRIFELICNDWPLIVHHSKISTILMIVCFITIESVAKPLWSIIVMIDGLFNNKKSKCRR